jgi:hypothetical protein
MRLKRIPAVKNHDQDVYSGQYAWSRDSVTRLFASGFFHESISPLPQSIPLRPFQICSKICGDIRKSRCTTSINDTSSKFATGVNDTGGKQWEQLSNL